MTIRLREGRARVLLTQDELAGRTGMTRATMSRLENGHQEARIPTVRKLAAGLGVDPAELVMGGEDAP